MLLSNKTQKLKQSFVVTNKAGPNIPMFNEINILVQLNTVIWWLIYLFCILEAHTQSQ